MVVEKKKEEVVLRDKFGKIITPPAEKVRKKKEPKTTVAVKEKSEQKTKKAKKSKMHLETMSKKRRKRRR